MQQRGVCHGFQIESHLDFHTLRQGSGVPLRIGEFEGTDGHGTLVAQWRPRPENPFHGRLFLDEGRYAFWASDAGWYMIDPAVPSIDVPAGTAGLRRELRMLGIPTALCTLWLGDLSLHAAAVDIGGKAMLLAGPAHHGKTTLSAGFARAGYRMLSEDTTRCRPGATPTVFPGPAVLRLRADVASQLTVPGAEAVASEPAADRTHLLFDHAARGSGEALPLAAIVLLKVGGGEVALRNVPAAQALRDLWALTFQLPTDESRAHCFVQLSDLVGGCEVVELERPLTVESLAPVVDLLARVIR